VKKISEKLLSKYWAGPPACERLKVQGSGLIGQVTRVDFTNKNPRVE